MQKLMDTLSRGYPPVNCKSTQNTMENNCLECSARLKGRLDKKFCDDNCRSAYHNKSNRTDMKITREINAVLRRNRQILKELYEKSIAERVQIDKTLLLKKGFEFSFLTQVQYHQPNEINNYCYDFGYRELQEGKVEVIKIDESNYSLLNYG